MKLTEARWFEVDVERLIEVDRGRDTILADRWGRSHGTVLLKLSDASKANLRCALEQEGK